MNEQDKQSMRDALVTMFCYGWGAGCSAVVNEQKEHLEEIAYGISSQPCVDGWEDEIDRLLKCEPPVKADELPF